MSLQMFLYLLALVLLVVAAFGVSLPRFHFGWAGLALWLFAAAILPAID